MKKSVRKDVLLNEPICNTLVIYITFKIQLISPHSLHMEQ